GRGGLNRSAERWRPAAPREGPPLGRGSPGAPRPVRPGGGAVAPIVPEARAFGVAGPAVPRAPSRTTVQEGPPDGYEAHPPHLPGPRREGRGGHRGVGRDRRRDLPVARRERRPGGGQRPRRGPDRSRRHGHPRGGRGGGRRPRGLHRPGGGGAPPPAGGG